MERVHYGGLDQQAFEVVERAGRYFARYDAGAHQVAWREDEISFADLELIESAPDGISCVLKLLQLKLVASGTDPYRSNWSPKSAEA